MATDIYCPYCKGRMELRILGMNKNKIYFYECTKCLARSPQTTNDATANSMARMRGGTNSTSFQSIPDRILNCVKSVIDYERS